jgi:hypothetical protein
MQFQPGGSPPGPEPCALNESRVEAYARVVRRGDALLMYPSLVQLVGERLRQTGIRSREPDTGNPAQTFVEKHGGGTPVPRPFPRHYWDLSVRVGCVGLVRERHQSGWPCCTV